MSIDNKEDGLPIYEGTITFRIEGSVTLDEATHAAEQVTRFFPSFVGGRVGHTPPAIREVEVSRVSIIKNHD